MRRVFKTKQFLFSLLLMAVVLLLFIQSCTKEKIIIYRPMTEKVELVYPPGPGLVFASLPELIWQTLDEAISYQVQLASDVAFTELIFSTTVTDTCYAHSSEPGNDLYYWRVRAKNSDDIWGDWSDASIWSFRVDNNSDYLELLAVIQTVGTPQDVHVVKEGADSTIAYVADGMALLTIIDVSNPSQPIMVGNVDTYSDDIAKAVWKAPLDSTAFIADMDGKIIAIDTRLPLDPFSPGNVSLGWDQNIEDITGMVYQDTIYLLGVSSGMNRRKLNFYQIVYDNGIPRLGDLYVVQPIIFPSDGKGVAFDSMSIVVEYSFNDSTYYETQTGMFVFAAVSENGLYWVNISQTHTFEGSDSLLLWDPRVLGITDTESIASAVFAKSGYAYMADDRGGLLIFDLPDTIPSFDHQDTSLTAAPVLVASINTSGRTKDVHVVGNYCYLADGSGGLKVIDVADPSAPIFLAAYSTPYAYGVWADENYIYITDRDYGLMIFEQK